MEAKYRWRGSYHLEPQLCAYCIGVKGANSCMIVVADNPKPGLGVARLVCNATDILQLPAGLLEEHRREVIRRVCKVTTAALQRLAGDLSVGWFDVNGLTYGGVGIDEIVFEIGRDGKATSVESKALRSKLSRTNSSGTSPGTGT